MARNFAFFDHTADLGMHVTADTLPELVHAAGEGLYAAIGQLTSRGTTQEHHWEFDGDEWHLLLRDYLAELLALFEGDHRLVTAVTAATFDGTRLRVTAQSAAVDREHSAYQREVKAVTYHELALQRTAAGFTASFIVDI